MLDFIVDDADVVEAAGQNEVRELYNFSLLLIQYLVFLYHFKNMFIDEFCLETL